MERPTHEAIREEALEYLAEYDEELATRGKPYYHGRTAEAIADFLLEAKFSLVDEDCDWDEAFCNSLHPRGQAARLGPLGSAKSQIGVIHWSLNQPTESATCRR